MFYLSCVFAIQQDKYWKNYVMLCLFVSEQELLMKDFLWARGIGNSTNGDSDQSFP